MQYAREGVKSSSPRRTVRTFRGAPSEPFFWSNNPDQDMESGPTLDKSASQTKQPVRNLGAIPGPQMALTRSRVLISPLHTTCDLYWHHIKYHGPICNQSHAVVPCIAPSTSGINLTFPRPSSRRRVCYCGAARGQRGRRALFSLSPHHQLAAAPLLAVRVGARTCTGLRDSKRLKLYKYQARFRWGRAVSIAHRASQLQEVVF